MSINGGRVHLRHLNQSVVKNNFQAILSEKNCVINNFIYDKIMHIYMYPYTNTQTNVKRGKVLKEHMQIKDRENGL